VGHGQLLFRVFRWKRWGTGKVSMWSEVTQLLSGTVRTQTGNVAPVLSSWPWLAHVAFRLGISPCQLIPSTFSARPSPLVHQHDFAVLSCRLCSFGILLSFFFFNQTQGKSSTTWVPLTLAVLPYFSGRVSCFLPSVSFLPWASYLHLPCSWDYRNVPPCLAYSLK
jgi:hypothetical protein